MTPREHIVSAARGDQPMDLVVRNVDLVNVFTAELYTADLGIKGDRYAAVARYEDGAPAFDLQGFREIDGTGRVAMPGFVDSHVHIESMMVPPDQFAKAVRLRRFSKLFVPNSFGMSDVELSVPCGLKAAEATNTTGISAKMTARMATMYLQPTAPNQLWPVIG